MIQTLRTLIVDDEPLAIERLQILTGQQDGVSLVGTASDGASALRMVDALAPDLVLCDIAMPDLNGLEVAAAIEALDNPPAVVFVTAFDRYAVAAFDVAAVDYLLKPVSPDRLGRALSRVREWRATDRGRVQKSKWINEFWVQNRGEMLRIDAAQVDLIEAERDYMRLHVGGRSFQGGLNIGLQYKNFDLTVLFQGASGGELRVASDESGAIGNYLLEFYENRWTVENPSSEHPRITDRSDQYYSNNNTYWLQSTNYIRLKNVELGYTLPAKIGEKIGISNLRVYVSGFNLLTFSKMKAYDPESTNVLGQYYPQSRILNTGLAVTF